MILPLCFWTEEELKDIPSEDIIFDVDNFNIWFNNPSNNAIYANPGIFLRLDKLSETHILDYLDKCYDIDSDFEGFSKPKHIIMNTFYNEIRKDWSSKL